MADEFDVGDPLDAADVTEAPADGGSYRGYGVLAESRWPRDVPLHSRWPGRFYVAAGGLVGLVPWPGSQVVWPWEQAWLPDLGVGAAARPKAERKH